MSLIAEVDSAVAYAAGGFVLVAASGHVNSSGWSRGQLAKVIYVAEPSDKIQDLEFIASPPTGPVIDVMLPIAADAFLTLPKWAKGIRVRAANNSIEVALSGIVDKSAQLKTAKHVRTHWETRLATYEDSHQPTGNTSGSIWPPEIHIEMKKLVHELYLTVEGPDEAAINRCFQQAVAAGLVAAIIAAYVTGGIALAAAVSAFKEQFISCLGNEFSVAINDRSHWVYWWT